MSATASLSAVTPASVRKTRAMVFGGGIGIFLPLRERFEAAFEIADVADQAFPAFYSWMYLIRSFRLPKQAWYRAWKKLIEHSPAAFRIRTRANDRYMAGKAGAYDAIFFLGAQCAPMEKIDKPLFIFTDSCRRLSSQNEFDDSCRFRDEREEREWFALEGDVYRSASRIFTGSRFVKNAIIDFYGVEPHRVVVSGFGAGPGFGELVPKRFDGRSILYIGKGDFEKKGGHVLLKAFERLRREAPEAVLHIVGQERLPQMPGLVNHGFMRDRVRMRDLMREAHVFALPSLVDRFGIALVEAMATATPCVTSSYGAMPEIVGEGGIAVRSGDDVGVAEAILGLLRDEEKSRRMGEIGRDRYEKIYNWDTIWKNMYAEIQAGLAESR